ncbi:MAG: hypothetical protein Q7S74_02895 [Nanoarchaeota archaeon]|nr:hypothetical protein [Nanoarchaeota archaeon]
MVSPDSLTEQFDKRILPFREYKIEDGREVNISRLTSDNLDLEQYKIAHKSLVISCHDVFIRYNEGILLVIRDNYPVKDIFWPIGGRLRRGLTTLDSLRLVAKGECGLDLERISLLGIARTFFRSEPFSHGRGTDTLNLVYSAEGKGELNLDRLHKNPQIINPARYKELKDSLHPYVKDFMDNLFGYEI